MKKLLLLITIITMLVGCKNAKNEAKTSIAPSQLNAYFQKSKLPLAIMGYGTKDGTMEWNAFGPSVWEGKETLDENNIFRIYSMTKSIASVGVMQLVEQGLIGIDDPLNELLPEMTTIPVLTDTGALIPSNKPITLRHLLTHTAGFGYEFSDQKLQLFDKTGWEYEDLPRLFEPGEKWHYGTNLDWAGKLIEKISKQDLETYLRQHVTGPLKMSNTWFNVPENLQEKIVSWGVRDSTGFKEYPRIPKDTVSVYSAGGGLFSSPKDYLTFLTCIMNDGKYKGGQLLKPETVELLFTNHLPNGLTLGGDDPSTALDTHGLAWAIEESDDQLISKGSVYWAGLANSFYTVDREKDIAIVYFTNYFPFMDPETFDFYKLYEKEVYARNE